MKSIYLLCDADGLKAIGKTKKELKTEFINNYEIWWYENRLKNYNVYCICYDGKRFDYDWGYGDFRMFEKSKVLENGNVNEYIEYDDYSRYGIVQKEIKKDFLYFN